MQPNKNMPPPQHQALEHLSDIERQKINELKEIQKSNDPRKGVLMNRIITEYPNIVKVLKKLQQKQKQ